MAGAAVLAACRGLLACVAAEDGPEGRVSEHPHETNGEYEGGAEVAVAFFLHDHDAPGDDACDRPGQLLYSQCIWYMHLPAAILIISCS